MAGRYVVGIDGTSASEAALSWAIQRALHEATPVVLAHVDETEDGMMGDDFRREALREGATLMSDLSARVRRMHPELDFSVALLEGSVARELADAVRPDDLLVIGTHKTGYLHGRVLGSRSVQIAIAVPCSVAVIPEVDLRFRSGVVAGIDRDETAELIATVAAHEAECRDQELLLLQADRSGDERRGDLAISHATRIAREAEPGLVVRSRVANRPPAEALLDSARDKALLVLGPGSLDPRRSPIGSVFHEILLNVNAPVLIARPAGHHADRIPIPAEKVAS